MTVHAMMEKMMRKRMIALASGVAFRAHKPILVYVRWLLRLKT